MSINSLKNPIEQAEPKKLKAQDFASNQEVRWCPGCGDYAILKAVQKVLPELGTEKHNTVFVSGIGCASRFPYYMSTYGFHTIHGRAPTFATGLKLARPELSVWLVTGDGDALSIGSNHLIHLMRRNVDINILLFNNQIYGLTKGQYSPTSESGLVTKSSPKGSLEQPINPIKLALAANCSFVARAIDVDQAGLTNVLYQAAKHQGTSFIEIYQNCHVFNDGAFEQVRDRTIRPVNTITLEKDKPLVYGAQGEKGLMIDANETQIQNLSDEVEQNQLTVYDGSPQMAHRLLELENPKYPLPVGVFYQEQRPLLEKQIQDKIHEAKQKNPYTLEQLLNEGSCWDIK